MQSYSDVTSPPTDALNRRCENPLVFSGYPDYPATPRATRDHSVIRMKGSATFYRCRST